MLTGQKPPEATARATKDTMLPAAEAGQIALYARLLAQIYPGRTIRPLLVWTSGPVIRTLDPDDVAAALTAAYGISVYARRGEDRDTYYAHLNAVADTHPQITMDDGADLVTEIFSRRQELIPGVLGGTEETTTTTHDDSPDEIRAATNSNDDG